MYGEWMDGIPILGDCHDYNAKQLNKAADYYEKAGNEELARDFREYANEEIKKQIEEDSITFIEKIIRKIINE